MKDMLICISLIKNTATIGGMRSWIKNARQFRANAIDAKQQDIRNDGVMRLNHVNVRIRRAQAKSENEVGERVTTVQVRFLRVESTKW